MITPKLVRTILSSLMAILLIPLGAVAAQPRDNDANAMIWGGAYSKSELIRNLEEGDGHGHGPKQLQREFQSHGITVAGIRSSRTVNGTVTKSGEVRVGDKVVATGAHSYGRHHLPGSKKDGNLYVRPTSVSFQQTSLPAFVHMDTKGSFKYAILKSCGNIVTATPKPTPQPKPKPTADKPVTQATPTVVVVNQTQTQTQTQTQAPAPAPTPQPAPKPAPVIEQLPEAGAPSLLGLAGISTAATAGLYYRRSRRSLRSALLAKASRHNR